MRKLTAGAEDAGKRLNKFLQRAVPELSGAQMHKMLRKKDIRVNGKRTEAAYRIAEGDEVWLYLPEKEALAAQNDLLGYQKIQTPNLSVVYEDQNILLVDKPIGMVVHEDETHSADTLINHIKAYLLQSGAWDDKASHSFVPALCNRIDRNTGGLVIAAKTAEALRLMNEKIRAHEVQKQYLCIVHGKPNPSCGTIQSYLRRDEQKKQVTVHQNRVAGAKTAITHYKTIKSKGGLSLVECTLETGRTHQIRAQMASVGCPLLGDGKYGRQAQNQAFGVRGQALYAYRLEFAFSDTSDAIGYLSGKCFAVCEVGFVGQYFGAALSAHIGRD